MFINILFYIRLKKMRAKSENNKNILNNSHISNINNSVEKLPIAQEAIKTNSNNATGRESVLFADKWFGKKDIQVRMKL